MSKRRTEPAPPVNAPQRIPPLINENATDTEEVSPQKRSESRLKIYQQQLAVFSVMLAVLALIVTGFIGRSSLPPQFVQAFVTAIGSFAATMVAALLMVTYLDRRGVQATRQPEQSNAITEKYLKQLRDTAQSFKPNMYGLSSEERTELFGLLKSGLESSFKTELIAEFDAKYAAMVRAKILSDEVEAAFLESRRRLIFEIGSLETRGNVNLVLGGLATLVGLIVLAIFLYSPTSSDSTSAVMANNIPRICFVVYIQLFGFFFLRLYRSTLDTMKYFHNEITNIDLKHASLKAALINSNEKTLSSILLNVCRTERNFLLIKGQSTVELEKAKIDGSQSKDLSDFIAELIKRPALLKVD